MLFLPARVASNPTAACLPLTERFSNVYWPSGPVVLLDPFLARSPVHVLPVLVLLLFADMMRWLHDTPWFYFELISLVCSSVGRCSLARSYGMLFLLGGRAFFFIVKVWLSRYAYLVSVKRKEEGFWPQRAVFKGTYSSIMMTLSAKRVSVI